MKRPVNLLVPDDDEAKRVLLTYSIREEFPDAMIYECDSGVAAMNIFECHPIDGVVTDYHMMPMDGIELVENLRRRGSVAPIIMVSSNPDAGGLATAAGVDLFLDNRDWRIVGKSLKGLLYRTSKMHLRRRPRHHAVAAV